MGESVSDQIIRAVETWTVGAKGKWLKRHSKLMTGIHIVCNLKKTLKADDRYTHCV